jgi:hypothetical protein
MRSIVAIPIALTLVLMTDAALLHAASVAHTQFRWKDAAGIPHYSDMLTPEALQFGYDVLNAKGAVVKHVERQRTPEELFTEESAAAAEATSKRDAQLQALTDQRMLAAYPNEKEFIAARQAQLDSIDQNIHAATNSLGVQERSLSDALARAASFDHDGKPVPDDVKKQIEALRKSAEALRAYVVRRQKEKQEATRKFEVDLTHYRDAREHSLIPSTDPAVGK